MTAPRFAETYCSQCGAAFGPGDSGFSHCSQHRSPRDKIHRAIEVVARSMFESDTLEPEREPNLWIEYIPDAKKHIASFLAATEKPSALQVAEALEQHEIHGMNAALKASRRRLKQELGL